MCGHDYEDRSIWSNEMRKSDAHIHRERRENEKKKQKGRCLCLDPRPSRALASRLNLTALPPDGKWGRKRKQVSVTLLEVSKGGWLERSREIFVVLSKQRSLGEVTTFASEPPWPIWTGRGAPRPATTTTLWYPARASSFIRDPLHG